MKRAAYFLAAVALLCGYATSSAVGIVLAVVFFIVPWLFAFSYPSVRAFVRRWISPRT